MAYKHRVVQGLADLIEKYGGGGRDPMMRAIWFGIKGQVPMLLSTLDNSEEAIAEIEAKLREVLGVKPEPPEPISIEKIVVEPTGDAVPTGDLEIKEYGPAQETSQLVVEVKPEPIVVKRKPKKRKKRQAPIAKAEVIVEPTVEE